jgi:hypothetical protein
MQEKVAAFVNSNLGEASIASPLREFIDWSALRIAFGLTDS